MTALVQVPTFEEALLGVDRKIKGSLPDRSATIEWPYYETTRNSLEELTKKQRAESEARQQYVFIRNIAVQATIPEETLRRLIPGDVTVPTNGIGRGLEAHQRELRQTMEDTLRTTFTISQANLQEQARQSGIIGDAIMRHNEGRMQDAAQFAAITAQLAEVVQ